MIYGFKHTVDGSLATVVTAGDSITEFEMFNQNMNEMKDGNNPNLRFVDVRQPSFFDMLQDTLYQAYKHPITIYIHADEEQRGQFIEDSKILIGSEAQSKDRHSYMIYEFKRETGTDEGLFSAKNANKTIAEITGTDKEDKWDKRTDQEKERDKKISEAIKKKKAKDGEVTGDSFDAEAIKNRAKETDPLKRKVSDEVAHVTKVYTETDADGKVTIGSVLARKWKDRGVTPDKEKEYDEIKDKISSAFPDVKKESIVVQNDVTIGDEKTGVRLVATSANGMYYTWKHNYDNLTGDRVFNSLLTDNPKDYTFDIHVDDSGVVDCVTIGTVHGSDYNQGEFKRLVKIPDGYYEMDEFNFSPPSGATKETVHKTFTDAGFEENHVLSPEDFAAALYGGGGHHSAGTVVRDDDFYEAQKSFDDKLSDKARAARKIHKEEEERQFQENLVKIEEEEAKKQKEDAEKGIFKGCDLVGIMTTPIAELPENVKELIIKIAVVDKISDLNKEADERKKKYDEAKKKAEDEGEEFNEEPPPDEDFNEETFKEEALKGRVLIKNYPYNSVVGGKCLLPYGNSVGTDNTDLVYVENLKLEGSISIINETVAVCVKKNEEEPGWAVFRHAKSKTACVVKVR